MKIAEKHYEQDGKLVIQQTHDWSPVLNKAQSLRSSGAGVSGESRLVGLIDMKMWVEWAKEAGIKPSDPAMKEVVKRKMLDPDFAKLRVWEGSY